jgi:hypothetical protein
MFTRKLDREKRDLRNIFSQITRKGRCLRSIILSIDGFIDYKRREFCNDVNCAVQVELNKLVSGSEEYEEIRKTCSTDCRYTTWQFHHWLIEKGYLIVRPQDEGRKIKWNGECKTD